MARNRRNYEQCSLSFFWRSQELIMLKIIQNKEETRAEISIVLYT